jgi:hypothetical protein
LLKTLDIDFGDFYAPKQERAIKRAFGPLQTLESLRISTNDVGLATAILKGVKGSDCQLRELKLACFADHPEQKYWLALFKLIRAMTSLKHLQMEEHGNNMHIDSLLHCLKGRKSISKLTLDCSMETTMMRKFIRFMGKHRQSATTRLCELVLSLLQPENNNWSGSAFATVLSRVESHSTIGSQVRSLTLRPASIAGNGFLAALGQNAHCIQLTSLRISCLNVAQCNDLAQYVSRTSSLQVLELEDSIEDIDTILRSLRGNGTLQSVTFPGDCESARASTFCHRNQQLGQMLQSLSDFESDQESHEVETTECFAVGK